MLQDLIYAILLGERHWQDFVNCLRATVPGGRATMFFHDPREGTGRYGVTSGIPENLVRDYETGFAPINPWMAGAARRRVGLGVVADQMLSHDQLARTQFYADFLRPMGCESAVGVTIGRRDGKLLLLSVMTPEADAGLNRPHADLLTSLAPHLARVMRVSQNAPPYLHGLSLAAHGIEHLGYFVAVLGTDRRPRPVTANAGQQLHDGYGITFDLAGRLVITQPEGQQALERMLNWSFTGPAVASFRVQGPAGTAMLELVRLHADDLSLILYGPTVLLMLRPCAAMGLDQQRLRDALAGYRITQAELATISALLTGSSPRQIAAQRGISLETVRSQMKSVYAKLDCRRQPELILRLTALMR